MADTNITHKDVSTSLSKTEWEAADTHVATHSIADNAVVTVDGDPADNEFARWTANGLEGLTVAETLTALGITDAFVFKGVIDCSANPNYPAADCGDVYKVSVAGKIGGASGITVEAGDTAICKTDSSAEGDHATVGANWIILQTNIDTSTLVLKSLFDAYSILMATTDDTPVALTVGEQTLVGRITSGAIAALTPAQVMALLSAGATATFSMNTQRLTALAAPTTTGDAIRQTAKITETSMEDAVDKKHTQLCEAADFSKLDGIEASADVTDAGNVAAAGAVMEADTTTAAMSFVIDEDNMASDLATKVPTQQSVKAYVDTEIAAIPSGGGGGTADVIGFRALLLPDGYLPYWDIDDGIVRVMPNPTTKWSGFPLLQGFSMKNGLVSVY
jgi:hypothetical protein